MAFSNLNNPYSPQPATPAGSTSGEDVFNMSHNAYMGDGMVSAVSNVEDVTNQQVVLDHRSRHNSAESDPSLVKSAPMSPASIMNQNNSYVEIGGQRLRHITQLSKVRLLMLEMMDQDPGVGDLVEKLSGMKDRGPGGEVMHHRAGREQSHAKWLDGEKR